MNYPAQAAYLLMIWLAGYAALSGIHPCRRMRLFELFSLSGALGMGCVGLLLFWFSLAGFATSRGQLQLIGAGEICVLGLLWKTKRLIKPVFHVRWKIGIAPQLVLWILFFYALLAVALNSLAQPVDDWDAFAIWAFKAKVLLHSALNPVPAYFHDLSLSYSHLDYPLMLPFLTAGDFAANGGMDDRAAKFISLALDLLLAPMIYAGMRWKLKSFPAALVAAVVALLPAVAHFSGTGYADTPLAVFYAGTIIYSARWMTNPRWPYLALAILFGTFTAFTKNEGLVLALAAGGTIFVLGPGRERRAWKRILFLVGFLILHGAWLVWNHQLPRTHEDYGSKLLSPELLEKFPRLEQIVPALFMHLINPAIWGLIWLLAVVTVTVGGQAFRMRHIQTVWIVFLMQTASYLMAYIVTPWSLDELIPTTADRLILQTIPAIFLIVGWHWAAAVKKSG